MITTTLRTLKQLGFSEKEYRTLADSLGGVEKYGLDTPISLMTILESNRIEDVIWCLQTVDGFDREKRLFACDCAESVLHIFESKYPGEMRPRNAIEIARKFADGLITEDELRNAAKAAAAAAAAYAAAAYAAADAAAAYAAADAAKAAAAAATAVVTVAAAYAAYAASAAAYAVYAAEREKQKQFFINRFGDENGTPNWIEET